MNCWPTVSVHANRPSLVKSFNDKTGTSKFRMIANHRHKLIYHHDPPEKTGRQPLSILHWQLTYDYSVLKGGTGGQPLQPAQRFWQIKQLGMTAADSIAVPITCDNPKVVSCAFTDHGASVVHLVNNGAARTATVSGLPASVKEMRVFVTDSHRGMKETGRVPVVKGAVQLPLDAMSFTSLTGNP